MIRKAQAVSSTKYRSLSDKEQVYNMSEHRKTDRRIQRTRHFLRDALIALVIERGYDAITIQDITDRANVARTTFYLHYRDKDELLLTSMLEIYQDLLARAQPITGPGDIDAGTADPADFEHVAQYADFYRAMLGEHGSALFINRVLNFLTGMIHSHVIAPLLDEDEKPARIPPDMIAAAFAGMEVGIMNWWLANDMHHDPAEMARMTYQLTTFGLAWALDVDIDAPEP